MKLKVILRKRNNSPFTNVKIDVVKDDGTKHSKSWICKGNKAKAKGEIAMWLRNITQKTDVVEFM